MVSEDEKANTPNLIDSNLGRSSGIICYKYYLEL